MSRWAKWLEGIIMVVIGGYTINLIITGKYAFYVNPQFMWLIGLAAVALLVLAGFHVRAAVPLRLPRIAVFSLLVILCLLVPLQIKAGDFAYNPANIQMGGTEQQITYEAEDEPLTEDGTREILDGHEYLRLNIADLKFTTAKTGVAALEQRYVVRGYFWKTEPLTAKGQLVVFRKVFACCAADSADLGIRVPYDRIDELATGQWVKIYGKLTSASPPPPGLVDGVYSVIWDDYVLVPDKVKPIQTPPMEELFIYQISAKEPFNY